MGQFIATHTAYVEGGRKFGEKLAGLMTVEKVHSGPMTGRRARRPRIIIKRTSSNLEVTMGVGNGHQRFFVHPKKGVNLDEVSREVNAFCCELGGYEVSTPQNGGEGAVQVVDEDPEESVTVRYEFRITLDEAEALVRAYDSWGGLPIQFPTGAREELGIDLWNSFKSHEYISAEGYGRAAVSTSDRERFDATQFVVSDRQGKFRVRWKEREEESWFPRAGGEWIEEIRSQTRQSQKPAERELEPQKPTDLRNAIETLTSKLAELTAASVTKRSDLAAQEEEYTKLGETIELAKLDIEEVEKAEVELRRQIEQIEALQARLDGILRPKS